MLAVGIAPGHHHTFNTTKPGSFLWVTNPLGHSGAFILSYPNQEQKGDDRTIGGYTTESVTPDSWPVTFETTWHATLSVGIG